MDYAKEQLEAEISKIKAQIEENATMLQSEEDADMKSMVEAELSSLDEQLKALESSYNALEGNFESEDDNSDGDSNISPNKAVLEVRAGTGGDEAGLFASDLYNMYVRYAEKSGWKVEPMNFSENTAGGFKTASVKFTGKNVYPLLKNESGVHRVQRVPKTESAGRIHTSTATVAVLPELKKVDIEIRPDDLNWEFYRAGGKGGQNVNKVATAVRLTHIPTGAVVECQEERTQGKNRDKALSVLSSRLYTMMKEQNVQKITDLRANQVGTGDRSEKIRTYNYPQDRITDHRINQNFHNIPSIMAGGIDDMLEACRNIEDAS